MIRPEQLDIAGFFGFIIITLIALYSIKKRKPLPKLINIILLLVGLKVAIATFKPQKSLGDF